MHAAAGDPDTAPCSPLLSTRVFTWVCQWLVDSHMFQKCALRWLPCPAHLAGCSPRLQPAPRQAAWRRIPLGPAGHGRQGPSLPSPRGHAVESPCGLGPRGPPCRAPLGCPLWRQPATPLPLCPGVLPLWPGLCAHLALGPARCCLVRLFSRPAWPFSSLMGSFEAQRTF